jgi:Flp pilus assembly protein TadD
MNRPSRPGPATPTSSATALRQAIALNPEHARAHNNLGVLLGRTGKADEGLAEFRKAGLSDSDAHLNLAFALGQDRKWPEARQHIAMARAAGIADPIVDSEVKGLEAMIGQAEATAPTFDATVVPASGVTSPSR